mmetsp:Transcript_3862/g.15001  ORF Transcript_3862/g.15001 Transcript_3862/m.15001 type:complete len:209 (+) Transcript_3862:314-940(+)
MQPHGDQSIRKPRKDKLQKGNGRRCTLPSQKATFYLVELRLVPMELRLVPIQWAFVASSGHVATIPVFRFASCFPLIDESLAASGSYQHQHSFDQLALSRTAPVVPHGPFLVGRRNGLVISGLRRLEVLQDALDLLFPHARGIRELTPDTEVPIFTKSIFAKLLLPPRAAAVFATTSTADRDNQRDDQCKYDACDDLLCPDGKRLGAW